MLTEHDVAIMRNMIQNLRNDVERIQQRLAFLESMLTPEDEQEPRRAPLPLMAQVDGELLLVEDKRNLPK